MFNPNFIFGQFSNSIFCQSYFGEYTYRVHAYNYKKNIVVYRYYFYFKISVLAKTLVGIRLSDDEHGSYRPLSFETKMASFQL